MSDRWRRFAFAFENMFVWGTIIGAGLYLVTVIAMWVLS